MAAKIDFNCDMGESFGMYKMGFDEEVIKHIPPRILHAVSMPATPCGCAIQ